MEFLRALVVDAESCGFQAPFKEILYQPGMVPHQLLGCVVLKGLGQDDVAFIVVQHYH